MYRKFGTMLVLGFCLTPTLILFQNCTGFDVAKLSSGANGSSSLVFRQVSARPGQTIVFAQDNEPFDPSLMQYNLVGDIPAIFPMSKLLDNKPIRGNGDMFLQILNTNAKRTDWIKTQNEPFQDWVDVQGFGHGPFAQMGLYRFSNGTGDNRFDQNGRITGVQWNPPTLVSEYAVTDAAGNPVGDKSVNFFLNDLDALDPGKDVWNNGRAPMAGITFQRSNNGADWVYPFADHDKELHLSVDFFPKYASRYPDKIVDVSATERDPAGNMQSVGFIYPSVHANMVVMFVDLSTGQTFYFSVLLMDYHRIPNHDDFILMDSVLSIPMVQVRLMPEGDGIASRLVSLTQGSSLTLTDLTSSYTHFGVKVDSTQFSRAIQMINESIQQASPGSAFYRHRLYGTDISQYQIVQAGTGIESYAPADALYTCGSGDVSRRCYLKFGFSLSHFLLTVDPKTSPIMQDLKWSNAGEIPGMNCLKINEPSDPHTWDDNFLCGTQDWGLKWSYMGPIPGMNCTAIVEPSDPDAWNDNYLCSSTDYGFRWSFAGAIDGMNCLQISEPSDPDTWNDNYLCAPQ